MPDKIKYNATGSEANSLFKGGWAIRPNNDGGGLSATTGFYTGVEIPVNGWAIYIGGAIGPVIRIAHSSADLISLTNLISGNTFTTAAECLVYYSTQSDKAVLNRDYEPIVTNGLVLNLDAGFIPSYPTSGTPWYDLSGYGTHPTLINGPTFDALDGSLVFDGTNDSAIINNPNLATASGTKTILCWCRPDSTGPNDTYIGLVSWGNRANSIPSSALLLSLNTNGSTCFVSSAYYYNDFVPNNVIVLENQWNLVGIITRQQSTPNSNNTTLLCGNANGMSFTTGNSSNPNRSINTTNMNLAIGNTDYHGRFFKGKIAQVAVYNRELSTDEITQNFNAQKARFGL